MDIIIENKVQMANMSEQGQFGVSNAASDIVARVIDKAGKNLVIAAPLGVGKPNQLLNEFYRVAKADSNLSLTIVTALSLAKPIINNSLAERLVNPILDKIYQDHIQLDYELDRRRNALPENVHIIEFYLSPGLYLKNDNAQQNMIYCNYTHVIRNMLEYNINVVAQLIAVDDSEEAVSLSCNCDLTMDLLKALRKRGEDFTLVGEVNTNLPYMYGEDALIQRDNFFALLTNNKKSNQLFVLPRAEISQAHYMIGLYQSMLIKDDGCLQIGIGGASDALVHALIQRQTDNKRYQELLKKLNIRSHNNVKQELVDTKPFEKGLYAATEMLVDGYLDLYQHGILKKKVYDDIFLQRAINTGLINDVVSDNILDLLVEEEIISPMLTEVDFNYLQQFGIFRSDLVYGKNKIVTSEGKSIVADLSKSRHKQKILENCLGDKLKNGCVAHAGFFLGSQQLFDTLREMPKEERQQFNMRSVMKINQLFNTEEIDRLQRKNVRCVNVCLKITLHGATVSDGLENGKMISGVGGQYNFVVMAQELEQGRSIISCPSTYVQNQKVTSNIVFNYGHITIPAHLRDIFVTEYGIADCRGKTDEEVAKLLLNIADSRFQPELLKQAKDAGKIAKNYQIPAQYSNNYPAVISEKLHVDSSLADFKPYPFGTVLSAEEVRLKQLFDYLKKQSKMTYLLLIIKGLIKPQDDHLSAMLERMQLDKIKTASDLVYRWLLRGAYKVNNTTRRDT